MVLYRAAAGIAIALIARCLPSPELWLGLLIATGFLSDVYDGILARAWGTATPALRVADSAVDTVFFIGVLIAAITRHWPALRDRLGWLIALLLLEATRYLFDWRKYGRMASYHSYASKLWSALLTTATIALLSFNIGWPLTIALAWGILCDIEGLIMSVLLPEWTHDVRSLRHALALRREVQARANNQAQRTAMKTLSFLLLSTCMSAAMSAKNSAPRGLLQRTPGARESLVESWRLVSAGTVRSDSTFEPYPEYGTHPIGYRCTSGVDIRSLGNVSATEISSLTN
jgi:CDP-diacylglycerol--glycerol-3-phosphate 3-phosphatidyltransferase